MIDADSLLLFPDFQADERLFQDLSRASRQVNPRGNASGTGTVIVQTFRPESAFFQRARTLESKTFIGEILKEREELFYPPFSRLVAIICQGKTEKEATRQAENFYTGLQKQPIEGSKIQPPHPVRFFKKHTRFESTLLLRFPAQDRIPTEWTKFLVAHNKDGVIDVDPLSFS